MEDESESLKLFQSQQLEENKNVDNYSAVEYNKSEFSADEDDKYFFLNFIHSTENNQDDNSAIQSNYQPKVNSSRTLSDQCEIHGRPYVAYCVAHEELV